MPKDSTALQPRWYFSGACKFSVELLCKKNTVFNFGFEVKARIVYYIKLKTVNKDIITSTHHHPIPPLFLKELNI